MKKNFGAITVVLTALLVGMSLTSCATSNDPRYPRQQLTSCPLGLILICESRQPPSKGGDEEIPLYDRCRCEPDRQD